MKFLLVSASDETYKLIAVHAKPLGFELIWYNHVIKAIDNLEEIDPDLVIISAVDFPRHWKIMAQFIRGGGFKDNCSIMLLASDKLKPEEEAKAKHLAIDGIIPGDLNANERLQEMLLSYISMSGKNENSKAKSRSFSFIFSIPGDITMITGEVKNVSAKALSFLPDNAEVLKKLELNMEFSDCSLRAGEAILSPVCRLVQKEAFLSMEFISFRNGEQGLLNKYLKTDC
ncbi:MAG: PilZ domain-containing protein [Treponema sp.]|jgi:hypothetical protein|nr:PilZ domain-containing protein [Treponema sp.]